MTIQQETETLKTWADKNGFNKPMDDYDYFHLRKESFSAFLEADKLNNGSINFKFKITAKPTYKNIFILETLEITPDFITAALALFEAAIKNVE